MGEEVVQIARYPNRRFYARQSSKYVSLRDIEEMVKAGKNVEIRDSQTNEDLTRSVLTRIIMEHQPEKMLLFPADMLHFILRSNDVMAGFLRDYFQHSLTYLEYLQRHQPATTAMAGPMHWVKAWLDSMAPARPAVESPASGQNPAPEGAELLMRRIEQLERRLGQLEGGQEADTGARPRRSGLESSDR